MKRALGAALAAVVISAVALPAVASPAFADVGSSTTGTTPGINACPSVDDAPVSSDLDPAGWDFSASTPGAEHNYVAGGLRVASQAGATSAGAIALNPARPLSDIGEPSLVVASHSGEAPVLGLAVEVDGNPAGVLYNAGSQWWDAQSLPGVPAAGGHAAEATLEDIQADVSAAGSDITVAGVEYALTPGVASEATIRSITAACTRYTFTAISPSAAIDGTAAVGQVVTADASGWVPTPTSLDYEWSVDRTVVSERQTYTIQPADHGKKLTLTITASGPGFAGVPASAGPVTVAIGTFATTAPTIGGRNSVGSTVTASLTGWVPTPTSVSYRWYRNGSAISGATAKSYMLSAVDRDTSITVTTTASHEGYTTVSRTSAPVSVGCRVSAPRHPESPGRLGWVRP